MERPHIRPLPQIPDERPKDTINFAEASPIHQSGNHQIGHMAPPDEPDEDVQQPRVSARQRQLQESIMLLRRDVDAQNDLSPRRSRNRLQRRNAVRYPGTHPCHQQQRDGNSTQWQSSTDAISPGPTASGPMSTEVYHRPSGQSYVEKQREEQQVHTKTHPGDIKSLLRPQPSRSSHRVKHSFFKRRGGSDQPCWRRNHNRKLITRRRQHGDAPGDRLQFHLGDSQRLKSPPNWPFGRDANPGRFTSSGQAQHYPLTQREIRLLLRNPLIRDGNMGPIPTPLWATPPRPPPHMFGIAPEPEKAERPLPKLPGLKRRNAQRRGTKSALQEDIESYDFESYKDRFNARFRRGSAARDVHVTYSSPVELARRRSVLPQIQEVDYESTDSESTRQEDGETEACQEDEHPQHPPTTTDEQDKSSEEKPQHQNGSNEPPGTNQYTTSTPRRFPLVVKGPRPVPASVSTSSSTPSTPPSSAPRTAVIRASTPASEAELEQKCESEHLPQDGPGCGTPGCTWADCSRIRGTFKMPPPGAAAEGEPEGRYGRAADTTSEDDVVSVGNGFSFLRLN